jgi:hypothetical protein
MCSGISSDQKNNGGIVDDDIEHIGREQNLLIRHDERLRAFEQSLRKIEASFQADIERISAEFTQYVKRVEFLFIRNIVIGSAAIIGSSVLVAIVALVIRR